MKTPPKPRGAAIPFLMALTFASHADVLDEPSDAADFLTFEQKIDGRCHNLSEGGKLAVMHNTHPDRSIDFRLIRYYIDVPQQGRATGTAEPNGAPVKLGCTRVGGREQRWEVERAQFNGEPEP